MDGVFLGLAVIGSLLAIAAGVMLVSAFRMRSANAETKRRAALWGGLASYVFIALVLVGVAIVAMDIHAHADSDRPPTRTLPLERPGPYPTPKKPK